MMRFEEPGHKIDPRTWMSLNRQTEIIKIAPSDYKVVIGEIRSTPKGLIKITSSVSEIEAKINNAKSCIVILMNMTQIESPFYFYGIADLRLARIRIIDARNEIMGDIISEGKTIKLRFGPRAKITESVIKVRERNSPRMKEISINIKEIIKDFPVSWFKL